ncbi:hypothetical protein [Chryseobacterium sp.]|uniref:hypothetical protein n=1 Tax=Chryseobacterium sp. TaxID=1871047 RepID=UPI00388D94E1
MNSLKLFKVVILSFLLWSSLLYSQSTQDIDQLINKTSQLHNEGNARDFIENTKNIVTYSENIQYEKGLSYGYYNLATYFYDNAKFRQSINYAKKANQYTRFLKNDKTHASKIYALLGGNYLLLELYTLSSKSYNKSLEILKSKGKKNAQDYLTESSNYSNMSYLYENVDMPDSMYFYLNKEKAILQKIPDTGAAIQNGCSCLGFGNYYINQYKLDSAAYYYTKSLDYIDNKKHPCKIEAQIGLGNVYAKKKDSENAFTYYQLASEGFENNNFPDIQSELFKKMAELHIAQNNFSEAKHYQNLYREIHDKLDTRIKQERDYVLNEAMLEERESHEKDALTVKIITLIVIITLILITIFVIHLVKKYRSKNQKAIEITEQLLSEQEIHLQEKILMEMKVNEAFDEIIILAKENSPEFFTRFQEVYPKFSIKMLDINPKFKVSELTFAAYIYLGFNTKEIAEYTFKAVKTIENNRYNLRKKLKLSPEKDLQIWIRNYIES